MISLKDLNSEFIRRASGTTVPSSNGPLLPKENPANIAIMTSRWQMVKTTQGDSQLLKSYSFQNAKHRNSFIRGMISYEESIGHFGRISTEKTSVSLTVRTDGIDSVSELDKEYARFADTLYKDVTRTVYNISHEEECSDTVDSGPSDERRTSEHIFDLDIDD